MRPAPRIERKNVPGPAEMKASIDSIGEAVTEGLKAMNDRIDGIEAGFDRAELKSRRPANGGGAGATKAERRERHAKELKAIGHYAKTGDDVELKSLIEANDVQAGYFVIPEFSRTMTKRLFDQTVMRSLARVETISTSSFKEPIDKDDVGVTWIGETAARPETSNPVVSMLEVPVHELYGRQDVSQNLLEDAAYDVGAWLEGKVTDKFGRVEGSAFISGDGVAKPMGILSYAVTASDDFNRNGITLQYVPSGSANSVADANGQADGIKALMWSLRAPYRKDAVFMMSSSTAAQVDRLKDGMNQYIWRNGMTAGAPDTLLGYPVRIEEQMPAIGANTMPIAFGNFQRGYIIVDRIGLFMLRDPYSNKPNVSFYLRKRVGGQVANSDCIKLLKCSIS